MGSHFCAEEGMQEDNKCCIFFYFFFLRDCGISFFCGSYEITFLWKKECKKTQMMYCVGDLRDCGISFFFF